MTLKRVTHYIETVWDPENETACCQFRLDGQHYQVSGRVYRGRLEVRQLQVYSYRGWIKVPPGSGRYQYIIRMLCLEGKVFNHRSGPGSYQI